AGSRPRVPEGDSGSAAAVDPVVADARGSPDAPLARHAAHHARARARLCGCREARVTSAPANAQGSADRTPNAAVRESLWSYVHGSGLHSLVLGASKDVNAKITVLLV